MRIAIEDISIAVRSWPTKQDFERFMGRSMSALDLNSNVEQEELFYSLTLRSEPDGRELWTVGVRSEAHGIVPEALVLPSTQRLVIGANSAVHFLCWKSRAMLRTVPLGFLFRSFILDRERSLILVVHETGLAAYSWEGVEQWKISRDLVETVRASGDRLEVSFMDSDPIRIQIDSGQEVRA